MASFGLRLRRGRKRLMFLAMRTLVRASGFARARALGGFLGELQFRLSFRARPRYLRDMAQVLGRIPDDPWVQQQMRQAYKVNTAAVLEVMAMFDRRLDPRLLESQCEVEGLDHLRAALAAGRGAILLGAHMGNGVLLAVKLALQGFPVSVVYRQSRMMSADFFERGFSLYGIEGILANEGLKAYGRMLGAVRKNRIVFLMMDQGVKTAQDGMLLRFLGKDMPMPAGPAQLARHARAPVLPVATTAADPVWRFRIEPPLPRAADASLEADVENLLRATERLVLQFPHLWSWHHRRWRLYPLTEAPHQRSAKP